MNDQLQPPGALPPPASAPLPGPDAATGQLLLPHGLRGALAPYPEWVLLTALALLLAALIGTVVLLWRWNKRRRSMRPKPRLDPWDDLLARIGSVVPEQPFTKAVQAEYYSSLSLMLREGIERRCGLAAMGRTYQELRGPLRAQSFLPKEQGEAILGFLERADSVKFAAAPSSDEEAKAAVLQVSAWITALRPQPPTTKIQEASRAPS